MSQTLRSAALLGIFLIPFVPLIVADGMFFPFITGKNFTFRILVELTFMFWALLALYDKSVWPKRSSMLIAFGLLIITLGVSTILSENPAKSFWSNFERMEGYIGLLHMGAYFLVATSLLKTERYWKILLNISIGVSVLLGLYGLMQLFGVPGFPIHQGGVRVDATLGNATYLAVYMLFHIFLTALAYVRWGRGNQVYAWLYGSAILLQTIMLFFAATRGTTIGLIVGLLVSGAVFAFAPKTYLRIKKIGVGLVVGLLVLVAGFFAIKDTSFVQNDSILQRFANISTETFATRFTVWGMAYQGFLERPVFGWGQESFNFVFNKYYKAKLYTQEPWFDRAHNAFIDWLIAGGILGFALYLSLYALAIYYLFRAGNPFSLAERGILTGLLAAYAFHNLAVFDNLLSYYLFFTVLAYILVRKTGEESSINDRIAPSGMFYAGAPVVVVVMALAMYFVNVPGMATATSLIEALKPHAEGLTKNIEYFNQALSTNGLGRQEAREQVAQFAVQLRSLNVDNQDFIRQADELAVESLKKELEVVPNDTRIQVFLGSLLRQIGRPDEAREALLKAHESSPEKLAIIFELGVLENAAGNVEASLSWLEKAYDLAPEYDLSVSLYAAAAIRAGDMSLAESLLMPKYGTLTPNDSNVLAAYLQVGDFERVRVIAEARVEADPTNSRTFLDLASVYLQLGRRSDAVAMIRKAVELDPTFKEQGEYFINEIEAGRNP